MKRERVHTGEEGKLNRRQFVLLSLLAGASSLLIPTGALSGEHSPKVTELLDMIADALLPGDRFIPYTPSELQISGQIIKGLETLPERMKRELLMAVKVVEVMPLFELKFKRFSAMSPGEREEYFNSWAQSRLSLKRKIFIAMKSAIGFAYFSHPSVWKYIGYEGPWVKVNDGR